MHAESAPEKGASWIQSLAAIDLRALAALRIGVAIVLLVDLAGRAKDLGAFYTDSGILSRADRLNLAIRYCEPWWMSLHMLSGSLAWAIFLACVATAAAVALLLGWRTRVAIVVSWLLLYSIQARFPMLLQGGDVLLRCTLVWMFFLPVDARWSFAKPSLQEEAPAAASVGGLGLLAQLCSMYFFSALLKTSPMWVSDFTATYYALNIDHFTRPLGYALAEYPQLLQVLTALTFVLELAGPLLMFEPVLRRLWRWVIPVSFIGFHLGLFVTLELGTFPWICILCWMTFLPSRFWDRVEQIAGAWLQRQRSVVSRSSTLSSWYGSPVAQTVAGVFLVYMLAMNTAKLKHPYAEVGGFPINQIGRVTGLEQYWNMFAPGPYAYGSWVRVEGELASGATVNLYEPDQPLANEKPRFVSSQYPTQYWRRCFVMGYEVREKPHLTGLLRYLAHQWNSMHVPADQVLKARFVFMATPTPVPGTGKTTKVKRQVLCELLLKPQANRLLVTTAP